MDSSRGLRRTTRFCSVQIVYTLSIYLALVGTLMSFISYIYGLNSIGTIGSYIIAAGSMPCGVMSLLLSFKKGVKIRGTHWAVFLTIFTTILCAILGAGGEMGEVFSGLLLFLMFPFFAAYYQKIQHMEKVRTAIFAGNFIFSILHIAVSFTPLAYQKRDEGELVRVYYLVLGYSNPNQTGMLLMGMFLIMLVFIYTTRRKWLKLAGTAIAVYLAYLIYLTDCRACILMVVLAVGALLISFPKKVNKAIVFLSFLAPFAMIMLEVAFSSIVEDIEILGETMATGRSGIFMELLEGLDLWSILVGNMGEYSHSNMHNGFLTVFARFGIIGTFCYVVMLWRIYVQCYREAKKAGPGEMIAFCGLLVIMIHSAVEGAFLNFGAAYASMMAFLMILTHPGEKEETVEVRELGEKHENGCKH